MYILLPRQIFSKETRSYNIEFYPPASKAITTLYPPHHIPLLTHHVIYYMFVLHILSHMYSRWIEIRSSYVLLAKTFLNIGTEQIFTILLKKIVIIIVTQCNLSATFLSNLGPQFNLMSYLMYCPSYVSLHLFGTYFHNYHV